MRFLRLRAAGRLLAWAVADGLTLGLLGAIFGSLLCALFGLLDLALHPNANRVPSFALGGALAGAAALALLGCFGRLVIGDTRDTPAEAADNAANTLPDRAGCKSAVASCNEHGEPALGGSPSVRAAR
jgi:hypothetical protein